MKIEILLSALALSACQSTPTSSDIRWKEMWVDIYLRHKHEQYSCVNQLRGYSKDEPVHVSASKHVPISQPVQKASTQTVIVKKQKDDQTTEWIKQLNDKVENLEQAMKANVSGVDNNTSMIVAQIKELKEQIKDLQSKQTSLPTSATIVPVQ